jgi:hypothetical protein
MNQKNILFNNQKRQSTLFAIGPMSKNCVDATIEVANKTNTPIMLIASRRQIDSKIFEGGYVNNWTTKEFSKYVKKKDKKKKIILCRDHGGPFQNNLEIEKNLSEKHAMNSAKKSFEEDIVSDFKIIHIDTSIGNNEKISFRKSLKRLFELYEHCWRFAKRNRKKIFFEIGTEEQSGTTNSIKELKKTLSEVSKFCLKRKIPKPLFVVIQTGTLVKEMKNVGSFETAIRDDKSLPPEIHLPMMIRICNKFNVMMKEHNADYLSKDALKWHPRLGIQAINVAPEFGVIETKKILEVFRKYNLNKLSNRFLELSFKSMKWKKWLVKNSKISKKDKAIISGHYVFSTKEFKVLKREANTALKKRNINIDSLIKAELKKNIYDYLYCLKAI